MLALTEVRFSLAGLVVLQLLTSLVAIALLGRVSPAVEGVLEANVPSLEAAERMLAALASPTPGPGARQVAEDALAQARGIVTEEGEWPLLEALAVHLPRALDGDERARAAAVSAALDLAAINREAIARADRRARRMGASGAWAMALAGVAGFLLALRMLVRLQERLLVPIAEVRRVTEAALDGDGRRRVNARSAPPDLRQLAENLDRLLDDRELDRARLASVDCAPTTDAPLLRRALVLLLDRAERPAVVVTDGGQVVAASSSLLDLSPSPAELARSSREGHVPVGWSARALPGGLWLERESTPVGTES